MTSPKLFHSNVSECRFFAENHGISIGIVRIIDQVNSIVMLKELLPDKITVQTFHFNNKI